MQGSDSEKVLAATFRFVVRGGLSPQLPLRLLGLFAQRDLMPYRVELMRDQDGFEMRIEQDGLTADAAEIVLQRIRVGVEVLWASCEQNEGGIAASRIRSA